MSSAAVPPHVHRAHTHFCYLPHDTDPDLHTTRHMAPNPRQASTFPREPRPLF
jgi:hypothetical protein